MPSQSSSRAVSGVIRQRTSGGGLATQRQGLGGRRTRGKVDDGGQLELLSPHALRLGLLRDRPCREQKAKGERRKRHEQMDSPWENSEPNSSETSDVKRSDRSYDQSHKEGATGPHESTVMESAPWKRTRVGGAACPLRDRNSRARPSLLSQAHICGQRQLGGRADGGWSGEVLWSGEAWLTGRALGQRGKQTP